MNVHYRPTDREQQFIDALANTPRAERLQFVRDHEPLEDLITMPMGEGTILDRTASLLLAASSPEAKAKWPIETDSKRDAVEFVPLEEEHG